jgi:exopolyphosphatase/pppGpp-phosphohydrolase
MEKQLAPVCAAIDVGSNTIHIVVARCFPDDLEILADELELVRIGESVTANGMISPEKMRAAIQTLKTYQTLAEQYGARKMLVVATEAIRQASNSAEFIARVRQETGLEMLVISGEAEAALTFLGATYEAGKHAQVGVMDLGGGSLELVFARHGQIAWRTSVTIGSGWLHDQYLSANPPVSGEIEAAETFLATYFHGMHLPHAAPVLIVTGGSANSLLYLAREAFHRPGEQTRLSREDLLRCQALLSALSAEDIARIYGQPLARARILLAGTLIIKHVLNQLVVQEITVSPHGIREGVLLAYARSGENWLSMVSQEKQAEEESFAESARKTLAERLQTMLAWSDEVLKHEDIEAVHKMRVASRRLRAAMDAYQPCCEPKQFARVYREIKRTATLLGEARDTDVMLHYLCEQLEGLSEEEQAGVRWLMTGLRGYRQQTQQELDSFLRNLDGKKLEHRLKTSVREGELA